MKGVLLDLGGVVYVGRSPIEGALAAIGRLRDAGLPVRFITNTTRRSRRELLAELARIGLAITDDELLTPAASARSLLEARLLSPYLLVHPNLLEDFAGLAASGPPAVVVGDAGESFTYDRLNAAYRLLAGGAEFIALARNRIFRDDDGELSLDAGAFIVALEYASGRSAVLIGKPSPDFFGLAARSLGCPPDEIAIVGDDAEADVGGAKAAGLKGVLVRTGKYQPGDEKRAIPAPDHVADDLGAAVEWLLG